MGALDCFLDELKEIGDEVAFSFSQSDWEDAIIDGFKRDTSLSSVLASAAKIPRSRKLERDDWDKLVQRAAQLRPALKINAATGRIGRTRVWIANNARAANDALWDGNYSLAKKLLKHGGKSPDYRTMIKKEHIEESSSVRYISARANDKRRDWNVCK